MMKYIRRTPYQALSAVFVLFITCFMAFIFSMIIVGSHKIITYFETRPQVIAFFKQTTTTENIKRVEDVIKQKPYVEHIRMISKEDALARYREKNKKDPLLLELVTADILPASIQVSAKDVSQLRQVVEDLNTFSADIDEVVYQKDVVESLIKITNSLRIIGLVLVGSLALTSFFVITIVTGMKISSKKQEIDVMRLLGATGWYIRKPFLTEGALYGTVGAVFGWIASYTVFLYATPWLLEFLKDTRVFPISWTFFAIQFSCGLVAAIVIGVAASFLALRRFIK